MAPFLLENMAIGATKSVMLARHHPFWITQGSTS